MDLWDYLDNNDNHKLFNICRLSGVLLLGKHLGNEDVENKVSYSYSPFQKSEIGEGDKP